MALPKQVQKDNEEIAAFEAALIAEQKGAAAPEQTVDPAGNDASPEAPVEVVQKPVVEPIEVAVDNKPTAKELEWEHRYKTLQGMQQAEVRSHKELRAQFEQLQAEVEAMRAKPQKAQPLVSDEETVEFGADLIDVQRRIAREEFAPIVAQVEKLLEENKSLRSQLTQVDANVASSSFEQKLLQAVPNFDEVNANPKWIAWLDEIDPILRAPRRAVVQAAYERGDVEATASYVSMFEKTLTPPATARASKNAEELKSQVAPSKSSSNAANADGAQATVYTEAEAGKLFDKVGQLYRQGKTEEASKLDAEITLAYHEGRVR